MLRRIIRRAIRHGYKLGQKQPFFHLLVDDLAKVMGEAYPELVREKSRVIGVLKQEEERFAETLEHGMEVLEGALHREDRMLDGETVFKLYDTFGFPVDLTADIARERGVQVDLAGFEAEMQQQRERARAASKFQIGAGRGVHRQGHRVPRLRNAQARRDRGRAVRGRHRRSIVWRAASAASWCSTARRSTPSPAARSAIAACWCGMPRPSPASRSRTRRRSRPRCSATTAW